MGLRHRHQPPLGHRQLASIGGCELAGTGEDPAAQVEVALVPAGGEAAGRPPSAVIDGEVEREPVRRVDEMLGLHSGVAEAGGEPVVDTREVGARVVHAVVAGLGCGAAGREVAVGEGAQRLTVSFVGRVKPDEGQPRRVAASRAEVELAEVADHHIGARCDQPSALAATVDANHEAEPAAAAGLDARGGVFDHDCLGGRYAEPPGRFDEHRRVGLTGKLEVGGVSAVDDRVEHARHARRREHHRRVAARGNEREPNTAGAQPVEQLDRGWEGPDAVTSGELNEQPVLAFREAMDAERVGTVIKLALRYRDVACREEAAHAVFAVAAVDEAAIVAVRIE